MKVGILCAGDDELAPFLSEITEEKVSEKAGLKFYEGKMCGVDVVALFSGVGKVNAAIAHVCYVNAVPFLAVRSITDTAKHSGVEYFEKNCKIASMIARDITAALLEEMKENGES